MKSSGINIRAISQEMPEPAITKIPLKLHIKNSIQISQGPIS